MAVDSTGKVGGKDKGILSESEATKLLRAKLDQTTRALDNKSPVPGADSLVDKVNIDLAKAINQQINPADMKAERADKVARLKELIAAGNYKPSSEAVARAVGDEIVQEILLSGESSTDSSSSASGSTGSITDMIGEDLE
jgi:anti-sigma28 factor (negative regulator of flagellin synthesis)